MGRPHLVRVAERHSAVEFLEWGQVWGQAGTVWGKAARAGETIPTDSHLSPLYPQAESLQQCGGQRVARSVPKMALLYYY